MENIFDNVDGLESNKVKSSFGLLFSEEKEIDFLDKKFDFELNPEHFIQWLEAEGEDITGNYGYDVGSMCEYSCLYIAMLLHNTDLKGEMSIYYGKFGFWEHYWIGYVYEGEEYFIDLTLKQFVENAPKLSISKAMNNRTNGNYSYLDDDDTFKYSLSDYIDSKQAFDFYTNPITMEKPTLPTYKF